MRYESFYPFAQQQPSPIPMGQTGFGLPPQFSQMQAPMQPFPGEAMNDPQLAGSANQQFGGQMPGQGQQQMPGQGQQQSPSRLEAYMQTANQFLNTAQQFAPVVQQFAPMVQNLPAMWRLYKGFSSLPAAGGATAAAATSGAAAAAQSGAGAASASIGSSIPRIFQPTNL